MSLTSASWTTGTRSPIPWLGATAKPMLTERLRWKRPSTHEVLTSGNFRNARAHARTKKSVIVTLSAPGTESLSCWRMLTAWSTRASTVTVNSGTVVLDSVMRRRMGDCIQVGPTISVSGPSARRAGASEGRAEPPLPLARASTSSFTIRPSGPEPFTPAGPRPSSAASRFASGDALTATPSEAPSLPRTAGAALVLGGGGASGSSGSASAGTVSETGSSASGDSAVVASSSATGSAGAGSDFDSVASLFVFSGFAPSGFAGLAGAVPPAGPMVAIAAPILAGTPFSTRIERTPSSSASRSNVALSDSTSARTSPLCTSSPSFFFHSRMVPSSIVSDSLGMLTSAIGFSPNDATCQSLDVFTGRDRGLLEWKAVRHGHLGAAEPQDRCVKVVEAAFLHSRGDLGGDTVCRPALFDHQAASRPPHRLDDGGPVDGADGTEVDPLDVDVLLLELFGRFVGQHGHPRHAHDTQVGAGAADCGLAEGDRVIAVGHHAADVVQAHGLQEHHRVVGPDRGLEHPLGVLGGGRRHHQQARDQAVQDLETVRVLRRQLVSSTTWHPDHQWNLGFAPKHVADLRGVVHDLVV